MKGSLSGCHGAELLFGEARETQGPGAEERDGGWFRNRWGCRYDGGRGECRRAGGERAERVVSQSVCKTGGSESSDTGEIQGGSDGGLVEGIESDGQWADEKERAVRGIVVVCDAGCSAAEAEVVSKKRRKGSGRG